MSEPVSDYPKIMHRGLEEITVTSAADEAVKREDGYSCPGDPSVATPDVEGEEQADLDAMADGVVDEPTFGPPHDQTHERRPRKAAAKKK